MLCSNLNLSHCIQPDAGYVIGCPITQPANLVSKPELKAVQLMTVYANSVRDCWTTDDGLVVQLLFTNFDLSV